MIYYVYIVECSDGTFYSGYAKDVKARLARHNSGLASKYTRSRLPVVLKWSKSFKNKSLALKAEIRLKKMIRKDKEALIKSQ